MSEREGQVGKEASNASEAKPANEQRGHPKLWRFLGEARGQIIAGLIVALLTGAMYLTIKVHVDGQRIEELKQEIGELRAAQEDLEKAQEQSVSKEELVAAKCALYRQSLELFFLDCFVRDGVLIADLTCQVPGEKANKFQPPLPQVEARCD